MEFTGTYLRTLMNELNYAEVTFCIAKSEGLNELKNLKDIPLTINVKKKRNHRSLNANAYYWVLADAIAKKLSVKDERPVTSIEVYKEHIMDIGAFYMMPIKETEVDKFTKIWCSNGKGWICDDMGESKLDGYRVLKCYYGSSVYNSEEMSRLIELAVADAQDLGIETMTPEELAELNAVWGKGENKNDL